MDDFDRHLEVELARLLDRVVRAPAPPRRGRHEPKPLLRLYSSQGAAIAPVATLVVLVDAPVEGSALPEPPAVPSPALFS